MGGDLTPAAGWRSLAASVAGTFHLSAGAPCADVCATRLLPLAGGGSLLALAACDGAGAARHSALGARVACQAALDVVAGWAPRHAGLRGLDDETVRDWVDHVRERIAGVAPLDAEPPGEYATTLLLALVDESSALFAQVGDGAIVYRDVGGDYRPAVWPQQGEYANATCFVTDELSGLRVAIARASGVDELALLTDGLQGLALRYATREAHGPFFAPMFARLRGCAAAELEALDAGLQAFLGSAAVNARTDDDKTLVLATRVRGPR